jgi:hypothetical protein
MKLTKRSSYWKFAAVARLCRDGDKPGIPETERHWLRVLGTLNEFQARVFVAQKALAEGRGGISRLAGLTGMSRPTIMKGIAELQGKAPLARAEAGRIRRPGSHDLGETC